MMTLRTNRHKYFCTAVALFSFSAAAGDFACLKALMPATDHFYVHKHRGGYSLPQLSPAQGAIAIGRWEKDRLLNVFVYTEESSRRFDMVKLNDADNVPGETKELRALTLAWLKENPLAVKLESLEVFQIKMSPPPKFKRKAADNLRSTASENPVGGWLIESENQDGIDVPIRKEIELRENWVKTNNLDAGRFRAWSVAEKVCSRKRHGAKESNK